MSEPLLQRAVSQFGILVNSLPPQYRIQTIQTIQDTATQYYTDISNVLNTILSQTERVTPEELPGLVRQLQETVNQLPALITPGKNSVNPYPVVLALQAGLNYVSNNVLPKILKINGSGVNQTPSLVSQTETEVMQTPLVLK